MNVHFYFIPYISGNFEACTGSLVSFKERGKKSFHKQTEKKYIILKIMKILILGEGWRVCILPLAVHWYLNFIFHS